MEKIKELLRISREQKSPLQVHERLERGEGPPSQFELQTLVDRHRRRFNSNAILFMLLGILATWLVIQRPAGDGAFYVLLLFLTAGACLFVLYHLDFAFRTLRAVRRVGVPRGAQDQVYDAASQDPVVEAYLREVRVQGRELREAEWLALAHISAERENKA